MKAKILAVVIALPFILGLPDSKYAHAETCETVAEDMSHFRERLLTEVKKLTAAIAGLDHSDANDNSRSSNLMNRGLHHLMLGMCDDALSDFTEIIALRASKNQTGCSNFSLLWQPYKNRAMVYSLMGQFEKSLDDTNWMIRCSPEKLGWYVDRARIYVSQKKFELALIDLNKVIEGSANSPDRFKARYYHMRGDVFYKVDHLGLAKKDYLKAIALGSKGNKLNKLIEEIDEKLK